MTLNEFKKAIEDWGNNWGIETEVVVEDDWTFVHANRIGRSLGAVATISNKDVCILNFVALEIIDLDGAERQTLFRIVSKFANTWPADRKDKEKKYYIISKLIPDSNFKYLCKRCGSIDELEFDVKSNIDSKFTQAEIEEIKKVYNTDLSDFELIEVEEDA